MTLMLRTPDLSLGDLEREVLDCLWTSGPSSPTQVHSVVGEMRGVTVNTVSSSLKRLVEKGLLTREKVSHSYVYEAAVTRSELQRQLIGAITEQFGEKGGTGFLAAFVDLAEERGQAALKSLEAMIADRLRRDEA